MATAIIFTLLTIALALVAFGDCLLDRRRFYLTFSAFLIIAIACGDAWEKITP